MPTATDTERTVPKKPMPTRRQDFDILLQRLKNERTSFESHWRDCGDYIQPRRIRFFTADVNRGERRNQKIIDSTATRAVRTLRSGMMGGITSPARPWFHLTTPDPDLADFGPVKDWLYQVDRRMSTVFLKSNLYQSLPIMYGDAAVFGTGAILIEEDLQQVIRTYPLPIGSYWISQNAQLKVDTFAREFRMTVRQIIEKFGKRGPKGEVLNWENFSTRVKVMWMDGLFEEWLDICHVISPNTLYSENRLHSKYKRYASCYYEKGTDSKGGKNYLQAGEEGKFLRESGYDLFPVLVLRWDVTGEDSYGTDCPGMTALGDIKALQTMQKRKAQAVEKMVNPPMTGPTALKMGRPTTLPGDLTYLDVREGQQGYKPAYQIDPRVDHLTADIQDMRNNIDEAFFVNLFLMIANSDRRQVTAAEIDAKEEEKLLGIGPLLEGLNQDALDPLIDITFWHMLQQGFIPRPPRELEGMELRVEYISIMHQARKLYGIGGIDRFMTFVLNLVSQTKDPSAMDKVDVDQAIDEYGELTSVPPRVVRSDDKVAEIRQGRQKQQQAEHTAAVAKDATSAAKNLAGADLSGDNALKRILDTAKAGQAVPTP